MPDFIPLLQTSDTYTDALELAGAAWTKVITFSILPPPGSSIANPVYATWAKYPADASGNPDLTRDPVWESVERFYAGNTLGAYGNAWAGGVKFRSAIAGKPATVYAERDFQNDIVVAAGTVSNALLTSGGQVTPPVVGLQVQEDGTVVGTEPALDFVNSGNVGLSVTDDSGNGRIQVAASVALKHGEVASNGTIVSGAGFTVNHSSTGVYVVSWNPSGLGNVIVIPAVGNSGAAPSTLGTIIQVSAESNAGFTVKTDNGSGLADEPWQFLAFPA